MPLHAEHPARVVLELDAFDQMIRRPRDGCQSPAQGLDDLMVEAIDLDLVGSHHAGEPTTRRHGDLVGGLVSGFLLAVRHLGAGIRAHVLMEASAEGDIEHLDAAADGEDGPLPIEGALDHPELRESLNDLLKSTRPRLERVLRNFEVPPEDAEDILQDAQLTLLYKWDKIRSPENWLVGTVKKKCIMYWRKRRGSLCEAVDTAILDLISTPQAPAQEKAELTFDLNRVLSRLSTRCRSLLRLRYGLGYGPTEVAEQMGYRTSSIRKVTNRCLAALTRQLLAIGFQREP